MLVPCFEISFFLHKLNWYLKGSVENRNFDFFFSYKVKQKSIENIKLEWLANLSLLLIFYKH